MATRTTDGKKTFEPEWGTCDHCGEDSEWMGHGIACDLCGEGIVQRNPAKTPAQEPQHDQHTDQDFDETGKRVRNPAAPFARSDDPETSLAAAVKAAKASERATAAVRDAMADGVERIDEEIWAQCRRLGFESSFATVRHGRVALERAGLVVKTDEKRRTSDNMPSRVWVSTEPPRRRTGAPTNAPFDPGFSDSPRAGRGQVSALARLQALHAATAPSRSGEGLVACAACHAEWSGEAPPVHAKECAWVAAGKLLRG